MGKYIYEVCLTQGRSNSDHGHFYENVMNLNAKSPDFGGINNVCVISHHLDASTIHMLCSEGLKNENDVTVEEITKESLSDTSGHHQLYKNLVESYFLPNDTYPNIK